MKKLIVGLGNPGPAYARTRHNAGFLAVEEFVENRGGVLKVHKKTNTEIAEFADCIVAKPRSMMNLSGGPTKALSTFFKITPANIIVLHDELDLDLGEVVHKIGGGGNGHNGLRDITKALGTPDYQRIKIGIGRPPGRMAPAKYVLEKFNSKQEIDLAIALGNTCELLKQLTTS